MDAAFLRSALVSLTVHGLVLAPLGAPAVLRPATVEVQTGVSSLELTFVPSPPRRVDEPSADGVRAMEPSVEHPPTDRRLPQAPSAAQAGAATPRHGPGWRNPAPPYPWLARLNGWEGTVVVRARVAPSGLAAAASVVRSSGFTVLDEAALTSVRRWRFAPASRGRQPVVSQVEIPIVFRLARE